MSRSRSRSRSRSGNPALRNAPSWVPLLPAVRTGGITDLIANTSEFTHIFQNNLYTVLAGIKPSGMTLPPDYPNGIPTLHLSIRRNDRKPTIPWRHLQRIKTEIAGAESEAVELYPAESRVMDGANQYHIFCFPPGLILPFGLNTERSVASTEDFVAACRAQGTMSEEAIARVAATSKQEPFAWDPDEILDHPGLLQGWDSPS